MIWSQRFRSVAKKVGFFLLILTISFSFACSIIKEAKVTKPKEEKTLNKKEGIISGDKIYGMEKKVTRNVKKSVLGKGAKNKEKHSEKILKKPGVSEFKRSKESKNVKKNLEKAKVKVNKKKGRYIRVVINKEVLHFINYYKNEGKTSLLEWMRRGQRYAPLVKSILVKEGVPEDLFYLSIIESGFKIDACSNKDACGPWQFVEKTARIYGLSINRWIDERRDFEKSTVAAARYLKYLYNRFGSWYLAVAAYNAGEGKVERAIKRYKTRDFWELSKHNYLRKETREYVPKMLAVVAISRNPKKYGFYELDPDPPISFEKIKLSGGVDLKVVAKCCGVPISLIRELNPQFLKDCIPPFATNYPIRIPYGRKKIFLKNFRKIPKEKRIGFIEHKVKKGDTLWKISRIYHIDMKWIRKINKLKDPSLIRQGRYLIIPITKQEWLKIHNLNKNR